MSTLTPEQAKALAQNLENTSKGLDNTLSQLKELDQKLSNPAEPAPSPKIKKPRAKKETPAPAKPKVKKESFTLSFDSLSAQDFSTIAELREAQTYVNFMDYYETIKEDPKKHLTSLFKKVTFRKGDMSYDLGTYSLYGAISPDQLEQTFYQVIENRKEYFEVDGDFNYSRSVRMKKESDFVRRDLSLKAFLAHRYPQEVLAMSVLMGCTSDTIGLLFETFNSIENKRAKINTKYEKIPNSPEKEEALRRVYFTDEDFKYFGEEGLLNG